jgi:nucleotide-binding universal stress UspA family protein
MSAGKEQVEIMEMNKKILIAVDESENAKRAVDYVAGMLGGAAGFTVTLLHVIPDPEEDFFPSPEDRKQWLKNYMERMETVLDDYRSHLLQAGFAADAVNVRTNLRYCPSMAECILNERDVLDHSTIVVGRQGLSRSEQFLFGSISSKIVNHAKNCTVWVVG